MTINYAELTGIDNYFENFVVGDVYKHMRGKTIFPSENTYITNMVMNTAAGHFNAHQMESLDFGGGKIVSYGGVNFSLVLGLSSQDCVENALEELGLDNIRLTKSVGHGDTLYASGGNSLLALRRRAREIGLTPKEGVAAVKIKITGTADGAKP